MTKNPRQSAFLALRAVQRGAFVDVALDRELQREVLADLDRSLCTELVYGCVRQQRTLDALIDQLATKKAQQQPPDLRLILHLGLYQLRYLHHIPASAAVNTTVELAKTNGLQGLTGFVNGVLRQYTRLSENGQPQQTDPLQLPDDPVMALGMQYSYPDWIVRVWLEQFGWADTAALCQAFNQPPHIDLRVNRLRSSVAEVATVMQQAGIAIPPFPPLPDALRLLKPVGSIRQLPGFEEGWWAVQDASAQLVSHLLDPQPGETIIDACAAPGGKTTHIAELMGDRGVIWACDRTPSRLKRLQENVRRLGLTSIQVCTEDSRHIPQFANQADRVLIDAPCSGLGTLHRHADARWRQTPDSVVELAQLQTELLTEAATWVKPGGVLVYSTCTLHPLENEAIAQHFLANHPNWQIEPPAGDHPATQFVTPQGWIKVLPHHHQMDGFFMVRLRRSPES
ncbi:16S rRNA (cytosine(967)-C(5))-methyltransferase [Oscillatoria sp. FACHB-1407]|uniref:16S rRNA (cytosine(967)-C(5))-methyltransferase n=1 Tax=Oscillatoria sp. FACHB-1407 TaxID=2692847 RepID=UPI001681E942|nr:16S rRNA (cytosine(967)-C(5))-methyltransferase [Oscillatoria sp. FACHB-1407]MBD2464718.1 16S rRNA (cytosine(967)-C(5))-methyltransferase [Oscillatoria sp. FACHB-1407]